MSDDDFLAHIEREAKYALGNSQHQGYCNCERTLEIIVKALAQYRGDKVDNPISWAHYSKEKPSE